MEEKEEAQKSNNENNSNDITNNQLETNESNITSTNNNTTNDNQNKELKEENKNDITDQNTEINSIEKENKEREEQKEQKEKEAEAGENDNEAQKNENVNEDQINEEPEKIDEPNNEDQNNEEKKENDDNNEEEKNEEEKNNEEGKEEENNNEEKKDEEKNIEVKNNEEQKNEEENINEEQKAGEENNNEEKKDEENTNEQEKNEEEKNEEKNEDENNDNNNNEDGYISVTEEDGINGEMRLDNFYNEKKEEEKKQEEKEKKQEEEEKKHERSVYSLEGAIPPLSMYTRRVMDATKIGDYLKDDSSKGRVGGRNLGNTCFMNSSIACLSNCTELTYYFLKGDYLKDINEENPLGMRGELAREWGKLMKEYWVEDTRVGDPSDFKYTIGRKAERFRGYGQQDSNEFMSVFLDYLNEDLNKTTKKEYVELKEKADDETDEQCARRFWEINLKRNDSIVTDLFCGQFKSTITCPDCNNINITFDPFDTINLPLLTQVKRRGYYSSENVEEFKFFYVPKSVVRNPICLKINNINNDEELSNVIERIKKEESFFYHDKINADNLLMVDILRKEKYGYADKKQIVRQFVYDEEYIFSYDCNPRITNVQLVVYFYKGDNDKENKSVIPRIVLCKPDDTLNDIRKQIYFYLRKYILSPFLKENEEKDEVSFEIEKYMEDKNNELPDDKIYKIIEDEYNKVFKNYNIDEKSEDEEEKEKEDKDNDDEEKNKEDSDRERDRDLEGDDSDRDKERDLERDNSDRDKEDSDKEKEEEDKTKEEDDKEEKKEEDNKENENKQKENEEENKEENKEKENKEENKENENENKEDENKEKNENEEIKNNEEKSNGNDTIKDENNADNNNKKDEEEKKHEEKKEENQEENNQENKKEEIANVNNEENQENKSEEKQEEKPLSEEEESKKYIEKFKSDIPFTIFIRRERDDNNYYGKTPFIDSKHFLTYSKKLKEFLEVENLSCPLSDIQKDIKDYEIVVQFNPESKYINKKTFDLDYFESTSFEYKIKKEEKKEKQEEEEDDGKMTLAKCLKKFCKEEQLQEGDEWYCSKCKKHVLAKKKMDLYYTPKILIICFKRFIKDSSYRWEKNEDEVDFPINDLDLKDFVIGPDKDHSKYDLFAVSQHYGGTGFGHYTAVCKNDGKWFSYNDSNCSETDESDALSSAAYVLFYRRKTD